MVLEIKEEEDEDCNVGLRNPSMCTKKEERKKKTAWAHVHTMGDDDDAPTRAQMREKKGKGLEDPSSAYVPERRKPLMKILPKLSRGGGGKEIWGNHRVRLFP